MFYVFGRSRIDIGSLSRHLQLNFGDSSVPVLVFYDVQYHHAMAHLAEQLTSVPCIQIAALQKTRILSEQPTEPTATESTNSTTVRTGGQWCVIPDGVTLESCPIVFIGDEGRQLTNLLLTYNQNKVSIAVAYVWEIDMCSWF